MANRYWLFKSEPEAYSIHDLERDGRTHWDGVRNYQARNFLRDDVAPGDLVLLYHSSANPPGVAGIARVVRGGYPDTSALDPKSRYFDEKATPDEPRWYMVDVEFVERFPRFVALEELKRTPGLENMLVNRRSRLSIQPIAPNEFDIVLRLGRS